MPSLARQERFRQVLKERTGTIHCALEAVYHRHNVSAILRTCDSLGLHNVHLVEGKFKPSKGPAKGAERWLALHHHKSAEEAVQALSDQGVALWVADLDERAVPPEQVPVDKPLCLWVGAELTGVSPVAREAAQGVVCLPMRGFSQSLNVSVAAALLLHTITERARLTIGEQMLLSKAQQEELWQQWMERESRSKPVSS